MILLSRREQRETTDGEVHQAVWQPDRFVYHCFDRVVIHGYQTNSFPTLLQQFFLERLIQQRNASAQTVASYRDSFCLLLRFAKSHLGKAPERLTLSDLDAPLILAFLNYLENERHNKIRSRNVRFAAIRSFMHFAALTEPAGRLLQGRQGHRGHPRPVTSCLMLLRIVELFLFTNED